MTIEEKAKAYDKVVNKLARFMEQGVDPLITRADVQDFFPELKESEDERIRKEIIEYIKTGTYHKDWVTWLEKQGNPNKEYWRGYREGKKAILDKYSELKKQDEQKPILDIEIPFGAKDSELQEVSYYIPEGFHAEIENNEVIIKKGEQKPVDMVEPKFKVGDWVVYDRNDSLREILYVYDIRDGRYYFNDNIHFSWSVKECDEKSHLWTIEDAKDGDVLACNKEILLFKSYSVQGRISLYCWYNGQTNNFHSKEVNNKTLVTTRNKICPATKEQRDLLFKKTHEAGYTFDFEKKELKKLKFRVGDEVTTENEESLTITRIDEEGYWSNDLFICDFDSECVWDLVEQKPAEWSEEDENAAEKIIESIRFSWDKNTAKSLVDWFDSLIKRIKL